MSDSKKDNLEEQLQVARKERRTGRVFALMAAIGNFATIGAGTALLNDGKDGIVDILSNNIANSSLVRLISLLAIGGVVFTKGVFGVMEQYEGYRSGDVEGSNLNSYGIGAHWRQVEERVRTISSKMWQQQQTGSNEVPVEPGPD